MGSSVFKIIFSFNFLLAFAVGVVRRFNYDARLYEHFEFDSRYIQYSRTEPGKWADIPALTASKNLTFHSMICTTGPGAWILYPEKNFQMGNAQLYYLIVGEHCVRTDDVNSIQPLGKMDELFLKGVLLFDKRDFGSAAASSSGEGEVSGQAGSIIFTGADQYTLTAGGKKICLSPAQSVFEHAYCLLPDVKSSLGIDGAISVKEKCDDDENTKGLIVDNCYRRGVHELYTDQDFSADKLKEVCSGGGDNFSKTKFSLLMSIWKLRLGTDLPTQPTDFFETVKIEILWKVLAIFKTTCPSVDPVYIYIIGHFYVMHMKEVWKIAREGNVTDSSRTGKEEWQFVNSFFDFCMGHIGNVPQFSGACRTADEFGRVVDNGADTEATWFEIANGQIYDPVIEQMWLIMNTVIPTCNVVAGYITNDWSELVYLFHKSYLDSLQEQWAEPGEWSKIYMGALHGYDSREVHADIVSCLEGALRSSPEFDPIGRPKSFEEGLLYKYSLPKYREISPEKAKGTTK